MRRVPCRTPLYSSPPFDSVREAVSQAACPSMREEQPTFAVSGRPRLTGRLVELQSYPALFRVLASMAVALAPVALEALGVSASSWPLPWCWKGNGFHRISSALKNLFIFDPRSSGDRHQKPHTEQ